MRKVNIILLIILIALIGGSSYYIFFHDNAEDIDYSLYLSIKQELVEKKEYDTFNDANIVANKKLIANDKYNVVITIDEAKYDMKDIDLLVIDKNELTEPLDIFYPSLGLINDDKINIISGELTNENNVKGVNVSFHTPNNIDKVLIYFAFTNSEEQRVTKYIEVNVNVAS